MPATHPDLEHSNFECFPLLSHREMMALMIPLCAALIFTSTVSALLIYPPQPLQPSATEPESIPTLSNSTPGHGRINDSLLSLPISQMLDRQYNMSLSGLSLSTEPIFHCDEIWGRDLNLQMCEEALKSIPWVIGPETRPISFGPREANTFDIGLPRRFMSYEPSHFRCGVIDPNL